MNKTVSYIGVEFSSIYHLFNTLYKEKKVLVEPARYEDSCEHFKVSVCTREIWDSIKHCPVCLKRTERVRIPERYRTILKLRSFVSSKNDFERVIENPESSSEGYCSRFMKRIFENKSEIWFYDGRTNVHFTLCVFSNTHLWFKNYINQGKYHNVQNYVETLREDDLQRYLSYSVIIGSGERDFNQLLSDSTMDNILYQCKDLDVELQEMQGFRLMKYLFSNESGFNLGCNVGVHQLRVIESNLDFETDCGISTGCGFFRPA